MDGRRKRELVGGTEMYTMTDEGTMSHQVIDHCGQSDLKGIVYVDLIGGGEQGGLVTDRSSQSVCLVLIATVL